MGKYIFELPLIVDGTTETVLQFIMPQTGNSEGGSISVQLTSCLTGLD
jgi:hypothetical protein